MQCEPGKGIKMGFVLAGKKVRDRKLGKSD